MPAAKKYRRAVVWMRRALRAGDNAALWNAVQDSEEVLPVVCLSDDPRYREDTPRRRFIIQALEDLDRTLRHAGSRLFIVRGEPQTALPAFARTSGAQSVRAVSVYDVPSLEKDKVIETALRRSGVFWQTQKDRVLFEGTEVVTAGGAPYKVFTPYKNAWLLRADDVPRPLPGFHSIPTPPLAGGEHSLSQQFSGCQERGEGGETAARKRLRSFVREGLLHYKVRRDLMGSDGTSRLSPHLALGTISIRQVYRAAMEAREGAPRPVRENIDVFIAELVWREFYYQILVNFPYVLKRAFKPELSDIPWSRNADHFAAWCEGRTGYPIVDAGMRQLNTEGWIHNRARMIVASFLTKDLHVSWQKGEKYFFERLIDADFASNNGGWQWTAGTGTDASPWFRIFNPVLQGERFDPDGSYVRRYLPELSRVPSRAVHQPWVLSDAERRSSGMVLGSDYPRPIVHHKEERLVTLELYKTSGRAVRCGGARAEKSR